jgi:hypothetical protein
MPAHTATTNAVNAGVITGRNFMGIYLLGSFVPLKIPSPTGGGKPPFVELLMSNLLGR